MEEITDTIIALNDQQLTPEAIFAAIDIEFLVDQYLTSKADLTQDLGQSNRYNYDSNLLSMLVTFHNVDIVEKYFTKSLEFCTIYLNNIDLIFYGILQELVNYYEITQDICDQVIIAHKYSKNKDLTPVQQHRAGNDYINLISRFSLHNVNKKITTLNYYLKNEIDRAESFLRHWTLYKEYAKTYKIYAKMIINQNAKFVKAYYDYMTFVIDNFDIKKILNL